MTAEVLSNRALNRALLERQMLTRRHTMPVLDAIEHLAGMQSQAPNPPYVGLWSRLDGCDFDELAGLMRERAVLRMVLMRGAVTLKVDLFAPVPAAERTALAEEGERLMAAAHPGAKAYEMLL